MKKIMIIILLMCISANAKEKGIGFTAEIGKDFSNSVTFTDLEVRYIFKFWNIELQPYGGTQTWFISGNNMIRDGKPFLDVYSAGIKIKWNNIEVKYNHYCAHPVMSDYYMEKDNEATIWKTKGGMMGNNSDSFSVKYEFN